MQEPCFTKEQLDFLAKVFNLSYKRQAVLQIKDGLVYPEDEVWWRHESGPEKVQAAAHWDNMIEYPNIYSISKPKTKVTYLYGIQNDS